MQYFSFKNVQGYWEQDADGITRLHFYGTNEDGDVILDLLAFKADDMHAGFLIAAKQAIDWLEKEFIPEHGLGVYRVSGHSFGGAVAVLVGEWLFKKGRLIRIETAGSPRVGGLFWWLRAGRLLPHVRYEVVGDWVPKLPPWWLGGWKHSGKRVKIVRDDLPATKGNLWIKHQVAAYQPYVGFTL